MYLYVAAQTLNRTNRTISPYVQRKYSQPQEGFWHLQQPPDSGGGGGSVVNNIIGGSNSASPSPLLVRKRFQTTIPVPENQYVRLQGNTSPIGKGKKKYSPPLCYDSII